MKMSSAAAGECPGGVGRGRGGGLLVFLLTTAPAPPDSRHWTQSFVIVTTMPAGRAWRGPAVLYSTVHCTQSAVPCAGSVSLGMLIVMEEGPSLLAGGGDSRHSAPAPPPSLLATLLALLLLSSLPPPAASHPHCSHHYPRDHQVGRTSQPGVHPPGQWCIGDK